MTHGGRPIDFYDNALTALALMKEVGRARLDRGAIVMTLPLDKLLSSEQ